LVALHRWNPFGPQLSIRALRNIVASSDSLDGSDDVSAERFVSPSHIVAWVVTAG
jgi:hypothetical protein